jgi:aspartyl-tRNA(Asn)/glutamyl-tRNA(Gln) amidotransferase subunit B
MRSKEEAHDYRYFPEPDLPPLKLDPAWVEEIRTSLPELPDAKLERFMSTYNLSADDALQLTATPRTADYYEECAKLSENPRSAANWIMGDLTYALKNSGKEIEDCPLPASLLAELIRLVSSGDISGKIAKNVFEEMYRTVEHPEAVVKRLGLVQISDESTIVSAIQRVKAANPKQLAQYRAGKEKLYGYFVGQVMKETKGQANPTLLNELLQRMLRE